MKKCFYCGRENQDVYVYCMRCGRGFAGPEERKKARSLPTGAPEGQPVRADVTGDSGDTDPPSLVSSKLSLRLCRRDFLVAALAGSAAAAIAVVVPIAIGDDGAVVVPTAVGDDGQEELGEPLVLLTYPPVHIARLSELKQGQPVDFEYPLNGQQNFLVKLGVPANGGIGPEGDIVAFSSICTHMGCPLQGMYKDEHKILGPCPCHYSTFDLRNHGTVVLGQATQNLPQVILALEGDDIYATGVMGLIYGFSNNLAEVCRAEAAS